MRDLITYCDDTTALMAEVEATMPERIQKDDKGNAVGFIIDKTPTVRKGSKTLSVVRCTAEEAKQLASLKHITVLANVSAGGDLLAAMSKTGRATYDSIHDQMPREITLEDGTTVTITPPELIGAFA
jgi:hypothetical protein